MRAPKVIFDIVLLALYLVAANPALTGVPFTNILGRASSCSWLPMLWRAVKAWAAAVVGRSACSTGRCWSRSRSASYRELWCRGRCCLLWASMRRATIFWGPLHALSAKVLLAALLVHIVLRTPAAASVLRRELARENER